MNLVADALPDTSVNVGRSLGANDAHARHTVAHTLTAAGFDASEDGSGRGTPLTVVHGGATYGSRDVASTLLAHGGSSHMDADTETFVAQAFDAYNQTTTGDVTQTLCSQGNVPTVNWPIRVRRLMPIECERLMGFPDGYTAIQYGRALAKDGPRYRALGNSWAVNCARWVGRRIALVDTLPQGIDSRITTVPA